MHVSKYYKHHSRYPANSDRPFHKVTHRHDMSIPGCKPLEPDGRYTGGIPPAELCSFYNSVKEKMKFFDDGHRMVYLKPEGRMVPVTPSDVQHPITYPPAGFVVRDGQWVKE